MNLLVNLFAFVATFAFMEFVAWFLHRYVMHGPLWILHRDHHKKDHGGFFEWNDLFFLLFAIPSIYLIYTGFQQGLHDVRLWIGLGIAAYGAAYVLVHDIFVHQRFRWLRRFDNAYIRALRRAHLIHHKYLDRTPGKNFGFLFVPPSMVREEKRRMQLER